MAVQHPIDQEVRRWLKTHVDNESQLSVKVGHSSSWLHKYVNGGGHATIDDLVRIGALLMGLNLPVLSEAEQKLLKACQSLDEQDVLDLVDYVEVRRRNRARRAPSTESSGQAADTPPARARKVRGRR